MLLAELGSINQIIPRLSQIAHEPIRRSCHFPSPDDIQEALSWPITSSPNYSQPYNSRHNTQSTLEAYLIAPNIRLLKYRQVPHHPSSPITRLQLAYTNNRKLLSIYAGIKLPKDDQLFDEFDVHWFRDTNEPTTFHQNYFGAQDMLRYHQDYRPQYRLIRYINIQTLITPTYLGVRGISLNHPHTKIPVYRHGISQNNDLQTWLQPDSKTDVILSRARDLILSPNVVYNPTSQSSQDRLVFSSHRLDNEAPEFTFNTPPQAVSIRPPIWFNNSCDHVLTRPTVIRTSPDKQVDIFGNLSDVWTMQLEKHRITLTTIAGIPSSFTYESL